MYNGLLHAMVMFCTRQHKKLTYIKSISQIERTHFVYDVFILRNNKLGDKNIIKACDSIRIVDTNICTVYKSTFSNIKFNKTD